MAKTFAQLAIGAVVATVFGPGASYAIWPIPNKLSTGHNFVLMQPNVDVLYNGERLAVEAPYTPPPGAQFNSRDIVHSGVSRALTNVFHKNFVPWKLRRRHSSYEPDLDADMGCITSIRIVQTKADEPAVFKPRAGDVDESYSLQVLSDGHVELECKSSTGCLHGLETLSQLFFAHSSGTAWYTPHAPVMIEDTPRFPHRGLVMDVARNWIPCHDIMRTIDAMAWNKMNRLHLHVIDSQSWPLEIPALPRLAQEGAYAKGLTYSPADIAALYEYGIHRGVETIMEIDMPGHVGSIDLSYKDLIVAYNAQPWNWYCNEPPCGAFRMNNTGVYDFLDTLLQDLLPRIAPYSAYFHSGGDEFNKNDSMLDPQVRSNSSQVLAPLLQKLLNHVHGLVRSKGLTPIVWEEMALEWNQTLGSDVVVQSWLGNSAVKRLAEAGYKVIDSDYNYYYLDCGRGSWLNYQNGAAFERGYPFPSWCDPVKNWRLIYSHDPVQGLSEQAARNVIGGEVAAWAETIDGVNLDDILWPRAGAAAEVLWSGRQDASGHNRSQYDAAPRLAEMRERMVARGVMAMPITMVFCSQGNVSDCDAPAA